MGIGLSEYRAAIGRFAGVAEKAGRGGKKKWKERNRGKRRNIEKREELKVKMPDQVKHSNRSGSLEGWRRRDESYDVEERSKSLNQKSKIRSGAPRQQTQSRCPAPRRKEKNVITDDIFKNACIACKTEMFGQKWQRGRTRKADEEKLCPHAHTNRGTFEISQLKTFICLAISVWLTFERALFVVVQMLLIRSGIETNPGPTDENNSICCDASQHVKRVKSNFRAKLEQDTINRTVIKAEDTGIYEKRYHKRWSAEHNVDTVDTVFAIHC